MDTTTGVLKVREHKKLGVFVDKLSKAMCTSAEQAVQVLDRGLLNRTVRATKDCDLGVEETAFCSASFFF